MKEKIKVWLVKEGEALPTDDGQQRLLRMGLIAEELIKMEADVLWWASSFDHNKKAYRAAGPVELTAGEHYRIQLLHGCPYRKNMSFGRIRHYAQERRQFIRMAETRERPDVILASMPNIDLALAAVKYGKKHNVPVFIDVRDLWPELFEDYYPKLKKLVHYAIIPFKRQLAYALRNATGIYATSEKFLNWALGYAKRGRRQRDGYYYVSYPDTNLEITEQDLQFWHQKGLSETDFICCFFGQFGHAVNIEPVLEASKELAKSAPQVKFVICGTGEKLESYKQMVGQAGNVLFPGWVDRRQICSLGKLSSAGLLAYRKNKNFEWSMPNKFCEYLALGLSLLIEPEGMMADLAKEHRCGYRYQDAHDLAEKLTYLAAHREEAAAMKGRARQLYESAFKADVVYRQLAEDLLSAVEKKEYEMEEK